MNEEIASALKNAVEHGASLEQAIQSFINAGYNAQEVNEAGASINAGASQIAEVKTPSIEQNSQPVQPLPRMNPVVVKEHKKMTQRGILIILLIILTLIFLGTLVYFVLTQVE